jgi:glutamate--cysteine ligase
MNHSPAPSPPITNIDQLVTFFAEAAKPKEQWLLGLEHEKLGVRADGSPVPYRGAGGLA